MLAARRARAGGVARQARPGWAAVAGRAGCASRRRACALRLVRDDGEVVQETVGPLFGGRFSPTLLRGGSVVGDEQTLDRRRRGQPVTGWSWRSGWPTPKGSRRSAAQRGGPQARLRIDDLHARGRVRPSMALLGQQLEPARARPGGKVAVKLRWRAEAAMDRGYKVFVHVLDTGRRSRSWPSVTPSRSTAARQRLVGCPAKCSTTSTRSACPPTCRGRLSDRDGRVRRRSATAEARGWR